ncbi:MAG: ATP-binding protein [Dehalococcoidia bacterium]
MYDTPAELLRAIAAGEDSYLELKEILVEGNRLVIAGEGQAPSWIARQLCCFANSDGGVVVLGVSDQRVIVGVSEPHLDALQQLVVNAGRENCEPPLDHLLLLDAIELGPAGEKVLKVEVRADYFSVHAPRGRRPTERIGNTCREVSMESLPRLLARRGSLAPVDERPLLGASIEDLDRDAVTGYLDRRFGEGTREADLRQLRNLKLVADDERGEPHPTVAGVLLFGRRPDDHINGAFIDLVIYEGTIPDANHQRDARKISGPIVEQIEVCMHHLRLSPAGTTLATKDAEGRRDRPRYSLRALQEAVVNALVHRDYLLAGGQVRVFVFDDRVEVSSPGRLPNSLSPDDLFAGAQPYRRNQILAGFLRDFESSLTGRAYMEGRAEGFLTMVRESEELSGRTPALRQGSEAVTVTIFGGPAG